MYEKLEISSDAFTSDRPLPSQLPLIGPAPRGANALSTEDADPAASSDSKRGAAAHLPVDRIDHGHDEREPEAAEAVPLSLHCRGHARENSARAAATSTATVGWSLETAHDREKDRRSTGGGG